MQMNNELIEAASPVRAMRQALEALEEWCPMTATYLNYRDEAITALRTAIHEWEAAEKQQALDKKAAVVEPHKNARELGLDYESPCKTGSQCTSKCQQCAVQEPVAWMNKHGACKTSLFREVEAGAKEEYTVPLYTAPPGGRQSEDCLTAAPVQEPVTEREQKIIMFAVHRFMSDSYAQSTAAAQDHDNRYFKPGAVDAFYKDAKDAEALIAKLREKNIGESK